MGSRVLVAGLVAAVAVGFGGWLLGYQETRTVNLPVLGTDTYRAHPSWATNLAAGAAVVAAMGAGLIVFSGYARRRR